MDNITYVEKLIQYQKDISDIENTIKYLIDENNKLISLFKHSDEIIRIHGFHYNRNSDIGELIVKAINIDSSVFDEAISDKHKKLQELNNKLDNLCNLKPKDS